MAMWFLSPLILRARTGRVFGYGTFCHRLTIGIWRSGVAGYKVCSVSERFHVTLVQLRAGPFRLLRVAVSASDLGMRASPPKPETG